MKSRSLHVISLLALAGIYSQCAASVLADSMSDFSSTQGSGGWYYGYYEGTFKPSSFKQMLDFNTFLFEQTWGTHLDCSSPCYWTRINAYGGHPNGLTTSGGRVPVDQWAVRRYIAEESGDVTIFGNIANVNTNPFGNGTIAHIFFKGAEIFSYHAPKGDVTGLDYNVSLSLQVGDVIDFALDPYQHFDGADMTRFTVTIDLTTIPEPSELTLLTLGVFVLALGRKYQSNNVERVTL